MKTETFPYVSGAADVGGSSASPLAFRSLVAGDLNSLVSFYLRLDFDARRYRFCGAISDNSIRQHCDRLDLGQSVVIGCFDPECIMATIELHPLFDNWDEAEPAVVARHSGHTTNILGQLLQLTALVAGNRGCHTLIVPFNSREHRLVELLRGMGRVQVHDEGARVDITTYASLREVSPTQDGQAAGLLFPPIHIEDPFASNTPQVDGFIVTSRVERKMIHFDSHRKTSSEETINPLHAWLAPCSLLIGGLLGVAFAVAISGASRSGDVTDAVTPESPSLGMILGASALQPLAPSIVASRSPVGQHSFAFGYLEFDWDLNAPGGVPGFEGWPSDTLPVLARSLDGAHLSHHVEAAHKASIKR